MITIDIPGVPKAKARPRFGKGGRVYTSKETKDRERDMAWTAKLAMKDQKPLNGALAVVVEVFLPIPITWPDKKIVKAVSRIIRPMTKPDADNILKTLDAFNGVVWEDDAQIVDLSIHKYYSMVPSMHVEVEELHARNAIRAPGLQL